MPDEKEREDSDTPSTYEVLTGEEEEPEEEGGD